MSFLLNPLWRPPHRWVVVGKPRKPPARPGRIDEKLAALVADAKERMWRSATRDKVATFRPRSRSWLLPVATAILSAGPLFGADDAPKRPEWCRPGYICLTRAEVVADAEYHLDLREQAARYRASSRRFGLTIGPSVGIYGVVDDDYDVRWVPAAGFSLTWGWRVR